MKGLDTELINLVSRNVNLPITYSGGFGNIEHLNVLSDLNVKLSGLAISGSLHYGKVDANSIRNKLKDLKIKVRSL